jgi:aminoglycoside phosphotransferase (APT) family kinase protein
LPILAALSTPSGNRSFGWRGRREKSSVPDASSDLPALFPSLRQSYRLWSMDVKRRVDGSCALRQFVVQAAGRRRNGTPGQGEDVGEAPAAGGSTETRLQSMIEQECGAGARVANFAVIEDGHAGLTFGFDVFDADGRRLGGYVLKLAPSNVARRGNTDVFRQASLLRALHRAGLPVPAAPWASPDEARLGSPFIVMERLPGRVFLVWEPHISFPRTDAFLREVWLQAARLLAQLHRIDWRTVLSDWEAPTPLQDEFARWPPVLRHAQESDWRTAGEDLGAKLSESVPTDISVGVVHGDFQPGNILYEDGHACGLID